MDIGVVGLLICILGIMSIPFQPLFGIITILCGCLLVAISDANF